VCINEIGPGVVVLVWMPSSEEQSHVVLSITITPVDHVILVDIESFDDRLIPLLEYLLIMLRSRIRSRIRARGGAIMARDDKNHHERQQQQQPQQTRRAATLRHGPPSLAGDLCVARGKGTNDRDEWACRP